MSSKGQSNPSPNGRSSKGQSGGASKNQSTPMTQSDASRIQSTQVWPFLIVTDYGFRPLLGKMSGKDPFPREPSRLVIAMQTLVEVERQNKS